MITFEQILDRVTKLPLEQQELLIDIIKRRTSEARRKEILTTSKEALAESQQGNLQPLTAEEAITELRIELMSFDKF